jgi:peptidoglycan/xylan/chitin deacetylase (PgdA/CDA1 family)
MNQLVLNLMSVSGAFAPFRMANRAKALILTYHRFSHDGAGETTSTRAFSEQLDYLTSHYRIVPLSSLAEYLSGSGLLPASIASIAIDDGYRDAYEIAFPILKRYKAPATLFVVTDFVDRKGWLWADKLRYLTRRADLDKISVTINKGTLSFMPRRYRSRLEAATQINFALKLVPDELKEELILRIAAAFGVELPELPTEEYRPITWKQAREMDAGGVQIGSHTVTHPILTRVSDERLLNELVDSRSRLQAMLGRAVDLFCYPNGDHDQRVSRAVRAAGYKCAVTVEPGLNGAGSDLLRLRRVHTQNSLARFIQCTSGFEEIKNRLVYPRRKAAGEIPIDKRGYEQLQQDY